MVIMEKTEQENIIPINVVLALKRATDATIKHKARFVLGGLQYKGRLVRDTRSFHHGALLIQTRTRSGISTWTRTLTEDLKQAYLQSAATIQMTSS